MQNVIEILVFFLSFLFVTVSGWTTKSFLGLLYHLLFGMRVAQDMPCDLEKIIMVEVSQHMQSRISRICGKISVFARMFISPLPQCLWSPNLAG